MATAPVFDDEQRLELLDLIKQSDSVELKLTVPDGGDHRKGARALGLDPLNGQIRQVFFFDTPDLALNKAGVVVRARRVQNREADCVIKLRPVVPDELPAKFRNAEEFNVEVDAMPGSFVCSGTMKVRPPRADVTQVAIGDTPIRKLFSKRQRAFYEDYAPAGIQLDDLTVLGPVFVLKLKSYPKELGRKMVVEMWLYPDGSRIIELSTKCAPADTAEVAVRARAFLHEMGVPLSGDQETKTKRALNFFADALANGD